MPPRVHAPEPSLGLLRCAFGGVRRSGMLHLSHADDGSMTPPIVGGHHVPVHHRFNAQTDGDYAACERFVQHAVSRTIVIENFRGCKLRAVDLGMMVVVTQNGCDISGAHSWYQHHCAPMV